MFRLVLVCVLLVCGCVELTSDHNDCYDKAGGNKTIYDQCVCKAIAVKYPNETDYVYNKKCNELTED